MFSAAYPAAHDASAGITTISRPDSPEPDPNIGACPLHSISTSEVTKKWLDRK
jgi:hypothetical protein